MKLGLLLVIALASSAFADPLTVEVKPSTLSWHVDKPVEVGLRVVNTSKTKQTIRVMTCSWDEHWSSSDPAIRWSAWDCDKNGEHALELEPGKAYENKLPMTTTTPGKHRFHMTFTPRGGAPTSSADVAIEATRS
jgi:hypothetical protein